MIRERPKSAMRRSESSAGVRNRRFSGFKSVYQMNLEIRDIPRCTIPLSCRYDTADTVVRTRFAASDS